MPASFTKTPLNVNDVREILAHIPPPAPKTNSREHWLKIIAATCDALNGDETSALSLLEEWQPPWEKNAYETAIRSLNRNYKSTAATLIYLAKENGYRASEKAKERAARTHVFTQSRPDHKLAAHRKPEESPTAPPQLPPVHLGKCSICESVRKPQSIKDASLLECLKKIKSGKWKNEVSAVRNGSRDKTTLPQINAFGVYRERRADENLTTRSGFIVLDYDGKDNTPGTLNTLKNSLARLPFVLAVFASPSGNGLKAVIRVPETVSDSAAFCAAETILAPLGGKLDTQSEARKHFIVSYDETAFINPAALDEIEELPAAFEEFTPETLAVIFEKTFNRFYFAGKDAYYFDAGTVFKELTKSDAREEFTIPHGLNRRAADRLLYAVRTQRHVSAVFRALSCYPRGLSCYNGEKILCLSEPRIIESDDNGAFPTIRKMLEAIFETEENDFEDLARFLAWLKHAAAAFKKCVHSGGKNTTPVPLLMLLGLAGAGKDFLFNALINPILGDRLRGGMETFVQEKPWLGTLIGCECILGTELRKLNAAERGNFKETIKRILGGEGYNAESKGKDGFTFKGQHFLVLLANIDDGGNCAASCPATDEKDFTDKFIALSLMNPERVKAAFPSANRADNSARIREEIPAFLYWLETYFETPEDWKDLRFGVKGFCSRPAREALFEASFASELDERIQLAAANNPEWYSKKRTATDILTALYGTNTTLRAERIGIAMKTLCKKMPERYESPARNKYRLKYTDGSQEAAKPVFENPFAGL